MEWYLGLAILMALIFVGVPIAFAMAAVGFFGVASIIGLPPAFHLVGQVYFDSGRSYTLSVVPLFLLMGNLIVQSGIASDMYTAANAWLRHRKGGLAMATIVACGGFSSVCGSSLATTATMARVSLPAMRRFGYSDRLATSSIAAGGTLGILIPPSVILVIYGILTQQNIGALFLAGILPGLVGVIGYMLAVRLSLFMFKEELEVQSKLPLIERIIALRGVSWALLLFVCVLGGIYLGVFTATEAAGIGAGGALVLTAMRGKLTYRETLNTLFETAKTTAVMFFILFGALYFLNYVNISGLTTDLRTWVNALGVGPYAIITMIVLIYLVLGCLLESLSMVTLTVPILFPIVTGLGFDPIWFGIFVIIVTEMSFITPPIGMNVFVMRSVAPEVPVEKIFVGVVPFVAMDVVRLILLIAVPGLALIIPYSM
ncbi:Sialic acid TRAP transporter permease protein SiaT [Pseudovibrio sp. W64]|uniref:TRAP transporter large permease n=1 Tax=unclassified Pseudovibrio TaxID=2627060 RepID=UPI0007AED4F2|nr:MULTISPECIES: TRAP transporter large permease [unclassified Pseudovibrio]KZK78624.1 Sialic acid TRAP transporter permease protein SiaT [Pseudovibrio sp. W64]KZK82774.1 Sialic acid TRAP transporter permease protein SiaT [Pseudovibrio sp. Ad13]KZK85544.1 Sialic acid TRAP transporter permease protein SiaT [Pseudovibrio sp. Ad46]KZL02471.1 Sialic acid TRAP transporter permease protein SiaT [Pseudovibrio sp. W74]KZL07985.1 Sialic acid TRAP transporter permease protein SiaT [Pseudovibrio sp. Ad14